MDIAICLIAYNRLNSIKRLLLSLDNAVYPCPVKLYISVDKSDVDAIHEISTDFHWKYGEKEVIRHNKNLGLRKHILECGNLLQKHDALIVLEDDIVVAPGFYLFAQATVKQYVDRNDVAGISLYGFSVNYHSCQPFTPVKENSDVFLMQNAQSWGQVWMKKQWREFKIWYEKNNGVFGLLPHLPKSICSWGDKSWLKYHTRYCIENDKYFVYPYDSYTTCFSDVGEHTKDATPLFQTPLSQARSLQLELCPTVRYDCYFENQDIFKWLGLSKNELCIDYYGDNGNQVKCRYWLSRIVMPYKVVKSYGLLLRPYELNIKYSVPGNDVFLYDTTEEEVIEFSPEYHNRQFFYLYGTHYVDTKYLESEIIEQRNFISILEQRSISQEQLIFSHNQTISSLSSKNKYWKIGTIVFFVTTILSLLSFLQ